MGKQRHFSFLAIALTLVLTMLLSALTLFNIPTQRAYAVNNGLALTPPMGWNSWNRFGCNINQTIIEQEADAMVSSGMKAAGYQYVNIDDCWMTRSRDGNGNLVADPQKFPSGIKAVADYVHSKGLKLGIYNDAGTATCAGYPGFYGHDQQDANTYASWGIDYIKVDWCNTYNMDPPTRYSQIASALHNTGRAITLSLCNWGVDGPWNWGPSIGNLWRTTGDISDNWNSMMGNFDSNAAHASAAGPGGWNDPDMLEVGNGGMSTTEDQTHFSLWAIAAAPLIAGNDLAHMSSTTQSILTNTDVIAVDQDAAGIQGTLVKDNGFGLQVWAKRLSGSGNVAVVLLNRSGSTTNMTVNWSDIGLAAGSASVRDLWTHTNQGSFSNSYTTSVPSHGVAMLKISESSGPGSTPTPVPTVTPTSTPTPVPTVTPTPTPIVTPTPTPGNGSCQVSYSVVNQWPGGFTANITIINTGSMTINGWILNFAFPNTQQVTQGWNGVFTQSGANVAITNASYNAIISPNASVSTGFNGSWSGSNGKPTAFTLNGMACSVVV
jgi:alpha-galactosidase